MNGGMGEMGSSKLDMYDMVDGGFAGGTQTRKTNSKLKLKHPGLSTDPGSHPILSALSSPSAAQHALPPVDRRPGGAG